MFFFCFKRGTVRLQFWSSWPQTGRRWTDVCGSRCRSLWKQAEGETPFTKGSSSELWQHERTAGLEGNLQLWLQRVSQPEGKRRRTWKDGCQRQTRWLRLIFECKEVDESLISICPGPSWWTGDCNELGEWVSVDSVWMKIWQMSASRRAPGPVAGWGRVSANTWKTHKLIFTFQTGMLTALANQMLCTLTVKVRFD